MQEKVNLLIVEDDTSQTFLIKESLDGELYEIMVIHDGREALEYLLSTKSFPDLILMDYHLPSLNGLMIMNKLKESEKKFNIIFLTADYSIETAIKSINAGALEFIPKDGRFVTNISAVIDKAYQNVKAKKEREKFEYALKESEARFKILMEASKDGIFEWNRTDKTVHISYNEAHLLGFEPEEYPHSHREFINLIFPEDREFLKKKFKEHHENNTAFYEAEIRIKNKDGYYKWILERGKIAEKDKNGDPIKIIGTHSDISERKANEEKIIEANRRLTTLISNLPGIVYQCHKGDLFNKEFLGGRIDDITGYSIGEFISMDQNMFSQIVHPADFNKIQEQFKIIYKKKTDYEFYYRILAKNGEIRWILDHGKILPGNNDQDRILEGYLADITEKMNSEEALMQSEEEKNIILDNSLQALILLTREGKVISYNNVANHKVILMVGKSIKKGNSVIEYVPPAEKKQLINYLNQSLQGESVYWEQSFNLRGNINWYENVLVPVFISRDEIKFMCFTSSDITDRKLAEQKILYSENLYNTTINSLNDYLFVVNESLTILLTNESLQRFNHQLGLPIDIIAKKLFDIYPFFKVYEHEYYTEVFQNGKDVVKENSISFGNKIINLEIKITPIFQDDKVVRAVTFVRDITERKNFEKRIMNAIIETEEKERKRFSEDLHDELGSLLSTIKIYINTLHRENAEIEKRSELVDFTNQLINQAIQSSKEIANNLSPNIIKRFGLISTIQSFCDQIQVSSGIVIKFDATEYKHNLKEDEEISIYRIISELINNTVKHSGARKIDISFTSKNDILTILYSDDGSGFDFEQTMHDNIKGLGLHNISSRIRSLNGTFIVENDQKNGFAININLLIPEVAKFEL